MSSIESTLEERGVRYGNYERRSAIAQELKRAMFNSPNWAALTDSMRESLEMTQHKISRILNGDPYHIDNWHDIIGYIRLVELELEAAEAYLAKTLSEGLQQSDAASLQTRLNVAIGGIKS